MSDWISVKDAVPPLLHPVVGWDGQFCLCYRTKGQGFECEDYNEHWVFLNESDKEFRGCTGAISYWIPLSIPPEAS